jgi:putative ABC transport system permease protein
VEGRNFNDDLSSTEKNKILINQTAAKAFGWENPIGKTIQGKGGSDIGVIIGVMKDFHYNNLEKPIEPLLHWYAGKPSLSNNRYLSIRLDMLHSKSVLSALEKEFKSIPGRRPFKYQFMNELVDKQYSLLDGILKVTNFVAWLTILIASMGMLGLITLFARRRIKEIGVRKVLGASVMDIATLLSRNFLKLVMIAFAIAIPIANWSMSKWLQDFSYRIDIEWWMFALAGILAVVIALLTVSFQAIKAALANPVKSLRTE